MWVGLEFVIAFALVGVVVGDGGSALDGEEVGAAFAEVDEGIVFEEELVCGVEVAFLSIGDEAVVLGGGGLLEEAIADGDGASIGEVCEVAGASGGGVVEAASFEDGDVGSAFEVVSVIGVVGEVVSEDEFGDGADVEVMGGAIAGAIVREFAVFDGGGAGSGSGEDAILVISEGASADGDGGGGGFDADAGAILVGAMCAAEGDARDGGIGAGDDPEAFAHAGGFVGVEDGEVWAFA